MKILMLLESEFPPDRRVENEISALSEAGHEVHLACFTRKNRQREELFGDAVIHRMPIRIFTYKSSVASLKFPFYFRFWRRFISSLISNQIFDVVHVHDLPLCMIGSEIKNIYNIPLIIDLHENWPGLLRVSPHTKTLLGRLLCNIDEWENYEKRYVRIADKVIVVVREAAERLMKLSIPEQKIEIVSNTINIKDFHTIPKTWKMSPGKKIMIYEGGITFHRGIQYVLKALAKLGSGASDIEFWIVGSGKYQEKLGNLSDELHLNDVVRFLGWQPQEKVYELISNADIAVIPHIKSSHTDNTIPHKLFHYMYAGLPILASDCAPMVRIINETSAGHTYKYDNTDELANKIKLLLNRESFSKPTNGKEWVMKKYNWDIDKLRLIDTYNQLGKKT